MNARPLVSILVPTFNEEKHIIQCLHSITGQDYQNLEIIVFDDCSTDSTVKLVRDFNDPRVRLIANPVNEKHEKTWNYLLTQVKGEFVKTVCADDLLSPTCISESVAALEARPDCIMSFCAKFMVDTDGNMLFSPIRSESFFKGMSSFEIMKQGFLSGTTLVGEPNNVLFRSKAIAAGVQYHFANYWMVDPDFYIQLSKLGDFAYVPKRLASFRISLKSWSVLNSYKQAYSFVRFIHRPDIKDYMKFSFFEYAIATINSIKLQFQRQFYYVAVMIYHLFMKFRKKERSA